MIKNLFYAMLFKIKNNKKNLFKLVVLCLYIYNILYIKENIQELSLLVMIRIILLSVNLLNQLYTNHSLKHFQTYTFCDFIEDIQWSKNSQLILIGQYKRSRCEIRTIDNQKWYCTIDEGIQGMKYALFSLTHCIFYLYVSIILNYQ